MYFTFSKNDTSPLICNVPHSSTNIPEEFKGDFVLHEKDLEYEANYMADMYTDTLYEELVHVSSSITSNISRIVLDIERFKNEKDEPMSKVGMSALYTSTSTGNPLRTISEKNKINLEKIYENYHEVFIDLVQTSLLRENKAIIVDCHSFPSVPRVYESDQETPRPDICIGSDEYHTPKILTDILKNNFEELGYIVQVNSPFSGSIIPLDFYKKDKRV
jgi:N-formylglutamate deformylase